MASHDNLPIMRALFWCTTAGLIINPSKRFLDGNSLETANIQTWKQRAPTKHGLLDTVIQQWITYENGSLECFAATFIIWMLQYDFYVAIHEIRLIYSEAYSSNQDPVYLDIIIAMLGLITIDSSAPGCLEYDCYLLGDALRHRSAVDDHDLDLLCAEYYYTLAIGPVLGAPQEHQKVRRSARKGLVLCKLLQAKRAFVAYQSKHGSMDQAMHRIRAFLDMPEELRKTQLDVRNMKGKLAFLYWSKWVQAMDVSDLSAALPLAQQATETPHADIDWLILLATILQNFHWRDGSVDSFHEGIQAVDRIQSLEESHPEYKGSSNQIRSDLYCKRFSLIRARNDIEIAVATARDGYANGHQSVIDGNVLSLCIALHVRGQEYARPEDHEEALQLINEHINSHGNVPPEEDKYRTRFASLRCTILSYREDTLEEAITGHGSILDDMDPHDPDYSMQQWLLGRDYIQSGQLQRAQELLTAAAHSMNVYRPEYVRCLSDLAKTYQELADHVSRERANGTPNGALSRSGSTGFLWKKTPTIGQDLCLDLLGKSMSIFAQALFCSSGEKFVRAHAGKRASLSLFAFSQWKNCYKTAVATIKLFPGMTNRELSMEDSQRLFKGLTDVSSLAAAALLKMSGMPMRALQLLESGRGVILKQFMDWKTDHTRLQEAHPELYQRFTDLQDALQNHVDDDFSLEKSIHQMLQTSHERIRHVRQMSDLRAQITGLPDFGDFDQPFNNYDIQDLAHTGSIIVLNSSYVQANPEPLQAFIVRAGNHARVQFLELPNIDKMEALRMADRLGGIKRLSQAKAGLKRKEANRELCEILNKTWNGIVQPILKHLDLLQSPPPSSVDHLPRVFWIASGVMGMLPLHAAGVYDVHGRSDQNATMYCVSSYAATVQALSVSFKLKQRHEVVTKELKLLLVAMPNTHGYSDLPGVNEEVSQVGKIMGHADADGYQNADEQSNRATRSYTNPLKSTVLPLLPQTTIAHFACHGSANLLAPTRSGLHLGTLDTPSLLTIRELSSLHLPHASFAYLSACSTAKNTPEEQGIINEVLHIASAFQVAGFPQVLGTLWEVRSDFAGAMAVCFYTHLRARLDLDQGGLNRDAVAKALHAAVQDQREKKRHEFLNWTGFVHFGH